MNFFEWKKDLEYIVFNVYGCGLSELVNIESVATMYKQGYTVDEAYEKIEYVLRSR